MRTTPINFEASKQEGHTVFYEEEAFSLQNPAYFRGDIRVAVTWNRKRFTSTLSLDIQNFKNQKNVYSQGYNSEKNAIETYYQTGLLPILNYKIEF